MAGTFTLKGKFKRNDGVTPYVNSTIVIAAAPYPDTTDDVVYSALYTIVTDANGAFSITLVTETNLYYRLTSEDNLFSPNPFTFLAPAASSTVDVTDLTVFDPTSITPTIAAQAAASAAAAQAAAASVAVSTWQPSTSVVANQVVKAPSPDGSEISSNSSRTTRASFDATEQTFWTPVVTKSTTMAQVALAKSYVAKGGQVIDLRDATGVVGDGVADDASAINTALAAAATAGVRVFARGTFKIGSTVTITGDVDMADALFNYTGTGVAVQVGNGTALTWRNIRLPDVVFVNKPATGWTASTIGIKAVNVQRCDLVVGRVTGFEDGLQLFGQGGGCAYNLITLRHLDNNKRNIRFSADTTGFANQNTLVGGSCSHNSGEGAVVAGVRHVLMDNTTNTVNNNTFVGISLESPNVVEYHLECFGWDNLWLDCRWENTTVANTKVFWRANTRGNLIQYGFGSYNIVEVVEAGNANTQNSVVHKFQQRLFASSNTSGLLLENNTSNANPVARVMPAGAYTASSDPTTAYTWEWTAAGLTGKRTGDAVGSPRVVLDANNGVVRVTRAATGSRPAAGTAGAGAMFLDSTLNKPIWSDGTSWRDATGTVV